MKKNFLLTALTITLLANTNKAFSENIEDYDALKEALENATQDINIIENITVPSGASTIYIRTPCTITINANKHNLDGSNFGKSAFINVKKDITLELSGFGDNNKETVNNGIINFNTTKSSIIYADNGSKLQVKNSKFVNNTTKYGVIYIQGDAIADIDNAIIINNFADDDTAGISVFGKADITNSYFKGNIATGSWANGVAILAGDDSSVHIKNSNFIDNKAIDEAEGGAIASTEHSSLYIDKSTFKGNESNGDGGAIYTSYPINFYIENSSFEDNKTTTSEGYVFGGGAINLDLSVMNETAVIYNSGFSKNKSAKYGGAIYFTGANDLYIVDSSFNGNTATISGGAIYSECNKNCALNIISDKEDVLFSNNTSNGKPNDIYNNSGDINLFASDGHKITFNGGMDSESIANNLNINKGDITYTLSNGSEYSVTGKGEVQFNNDVKNLNVNLYGGMLSIGQNKDINSSISNPDGFLNNSNFNIKGDSILNTVNNVIGEFHPVEFRVDSGVNWEYHFDIDLANKTSDKLYVTDNQGSLTLGLLNLITDTEAKEVKVTYSDTNINGKLKEDYQIVTTSEKTYNITAGNDEDGSYLLIKQDSLASGLAAAVDNASDVYSNTADSDEIVEHWLGDDEDHNFLQNDLTIFANNKGIIAGQEDLDGLVVGEDFHLSVHNAQDFSGFNIAIDNKGIVDLYDSNFRGNKGEAAVKIAEEI